MRRLRTGRADADLPRLCRGAEDVRRRNPARPARGLRVSDSPAADLAAWIAAGPHGPGDHRHRRPTSLRLTAPWPGPGPNSAVPDALAAMARLVDAARAAGVSVVFTRVETRPETDSAAWADQIRRRGGDPDLDAAVCRAGSAGAAFFGVESRPTPSLVVAKRRYSAFFGTGLHAGADGPWDRHPGALRPDHRMLRRLHGARRLSPRLSRLHRRRRLRGL